jgi:deazaflavin-dependent oxidoreductase (nitroreductase family)
MRRTAWSGIVVVALLVAVTRGPAELANAPVRWILRSPLHGVASSQLLLLELTSRESGGAYVIPVNYVARGDFLLVGSDFTWWRDLEAEPRVRVELGNNPPREARAAIVRDEAARDAGWRTLRPRSFVSALASEAVLIELTLEPEAAP